MWTWGWKPVDVIFCQGASRTSPRTPRSYSRCEAHVSFIYGVEYLYIVVEICLEKEILIIIKYEIPAKYQYNRALANSNNMKRDINTINCTKELLHKRKMLAIHTAGKENNPN